MDYRHLLYWFFPGIFSGILGRCLASVTCKVTSNFYLEVPVLLVTESTLFEYPLANWYIVYYGLQYPVPVLEQTFIPAF